MSARKPAVETPSYVEAVNLAPDSELKWRVLRYAEAELERRHVEWLHESIGALRETVNDYRHGLAARRRDPEAKVAVATREGLRATLALARQRADLDKLTEIAYRFAANQVFMETGQRVGPRAWPEESGPSVAAAAAVADGSAAAIRAEVLGDDDVETTDAVAATEPGDGQRPEAAAHEQRRDGAATPRLPPVSGKLVKQQYRRLVNNKLPLEVCEDFKRVARSGTLTREQVIAKAEALLSAA